MSIINAVLSLIGLGNDRDLCVEEPLAPNRMTPSSVRVKDYIHDSRFFQTHPTPTHVMAKNAEGLFHLMPLDSIKDQ